MEIRYANKFLKRYEQADRKIQAAFDKRRTIFKQDPFHPLLNNHKLTGTYEGCRSINITGDWRAVYLETSEAIVFINLGTHSQLYR